MIDLHCHILPSIDDGAKTFDDSLAMLEQAEKAGITDIVLTPHYMKGTVYNADNVKKWGLYQELRKRANDAGISINLYLGNEIYIDTKMREMLAGYTNEQSELMYEVSTLNSTKYVLVEFPVRTEDKSVKTTLFSLVQKGFIPVIAHPERYFYVQDNPAWVDDLIHMGCKLQGNYMSLFGKYGKGAEKTLKKLLLEDKIFCLASDIHKPENYKLDLAQKKLMKIVRDKNKIDELLVTNPAMIIRGK